MIIQDSQVDIGDLWEISVPGKKWCSARTTELLPKSSGDVVAGYLILSLTNAEIRRGYLDIGRKSGAAQLLTDGTIAKARVARLAYKLEPNVPTLTLP